MRMCRHCASMGLVSFERVYGAFALLSAAANGQYNKDSHSHKTDQGRSQHVPENGLADALQEPGDGVDDEQRGDGRLLGADGERDQGRRDEPAEEVDPGDAKVAAGLGPHPVAPANHLGVEKEIPGRKGQGADDDKAPAVRSADNRRPNGPGGGSIISQASGMMSGTPPSRGASDAV